MSNIKPGDPNALTEVLKAHQGIFYGVPVNIYFMWNGDFTCKMQKESLKEPSGKVPTVFAAPSFDSVWIKTLYTTANVS